MISDFRYRQVWRKNGVTAFYPYANPPSFGVDAMAETEAREPDAVAESLQAVLKQSSSAWQDPEKKVNQGKLNWKQTPCSHCQLVKCVGGYCTKMWIGVYLMCSRCKLATWHQDVSEDDKTKKRKCREEAQRPLLLLAVLNVKAIIGVLPQWGWPDVVSAQNEQNMYCIVL